MSIHKISTEATSTFCILEGHTTLASNQREGLQHLHGVHARSFNAAEPLSVGTVDLFDLAVAVVSDDLLY